MVGETCLHSILAHCVFQVQCWTKVKDLDRSLENVLNVILVLNVTRTQIKSTTNVGNWQTFTVQLYGEVIPPLSSHHLSHISLEDVKENIEIYHYTKSTWSQSLTVVQHTLFSIYKPPNDLFYTCNTVVLYNLISLGVSAHAVAGSLAWIRMRHSLCTP